MWRKSGISLMASSAAAALIASSLVVISANSATADSQHESPIVTHRLAESDATTVQVDYTTHVVGIHLPGVETSTKSVDLAEVPDGLARSKGEALLTTEYGSSTISTFATDEGTQTFIEIPAPNSPTEYAFDLTIPDDAVIGVEADGSVAIRDQRGNLLSGYEAPWAIDANGVSVATSFRIEGSTLIQTVDLNGATAYPVIADPSDLWGWAACIGTVLAEVAGNALVAAKFAKLVTKFGTIQRAVEIMVRAWRASSDVNKRTQAVLKAVGAVGAEILGVTAIKNACFS